MWVWADRNSRLEFIAAYTSTTTSTLLHEPWRHLKQGKAIGSSHSNHAFRILQGINEPPRRWTRYFFGRLIARCIEHDSRYVQFLQREWSWLNLFNHLLAVGDFLLKFHSSFLTQLFSYLPTTASSSYISSITKYSKTPPYVITKPSLRYINLKPFWDCNPLLLLFMDGVDNIVSGEFDFMLMPHKEDLSDVVCTLLGDKIGTCVEDILGHGVESRWSGCDGNRAIEVLGNLLGGTDTGRLSMTMDLAIFSWGEDAQFYIDDTSIIVCDISTATILPWSTLMQYSYNLISLYVVLKAWHWQQDAYNTLSGNCLVVNIHKGERPSCASLNLNFDYIVVGATIISMCSSSNAWETLLFPIQL